MQWIINIILKINLGPTIENRGPHLRIKGYFHLDRIPSSTIEGGEIIDMSG